VATQAVVNKDLCATLQGGLVVQIDVGVLKVSTTTRHTQHRQGGEYKSYD
jgi:hypothetical protein